MLKWGIKYAAVFSQEDFPFCHLFPFIIFSHIVTDLCQVEFIQAYDIYNTLFISSWRQSDKKIQQHIIFPPERGMYLSIWNSNADKALKCIVSHTNKTKQNLNFSMFLKSKWKIYIVLRKHRRLDSRWWDKNFISCIDKEKVLVKTKSGKE